MDLRTKGLLHFYTFVCATVIVFTAAPLHAVDEESSPTLGGEPTCSYGKDIFTNGLRGYCIQKGPQRFTLLYEDFSGGRVDMWDYPGAFENPPRDVDCKLLCEAGVLRVFYSKELYVRPKKRGAVDRKTRSCPLQPDAAVDYIECHAGNDLNCFGMCGLGCIGCEENYGNSCNSDPECLYLKLNCYTRRCCRIHDRCLANSPFGMLDVVCHIQALRNGCGLSDARGQSFMDQDARCQRIGPWCVEGYE